MMAHDVGEAGNAGEIALARLASRIFLGVIVVFWPICYSWRDDPEVVDNQNRGSL
jgi:hypothetical protein